MVVALRHSPRDVPGPFREMPMSGGVTEPELFYPTDQEGVIVHAPKAPGTRCPTCALEGKEVWVIPGRCCGYCGTPCDTEHPDYDRRHHHHH